MRVGILGGGQLGLMLAESIQHLGHQALVYERDADSPCHQRLASVTTGTLEDTPRLQSFLQQVDVVTFDSENIPAAPLEPFAAKLFPSLQVLQTCQDRLAEKRFLSANGFSPVDFAWVDEGAPVLATAEKLGFPCVAKTIRGGYDGKGQTRLNGYEDAVRYDRKRQTLDSAPALVLESFVELLAEVSCVVARDASGAIWPFPVFENIHRNHILDFTLVPARLEQNHQTQALTMAGDIAQALQVVGLLTVEFFLAKSADRTPKLLVNELAPRTHNSGHVTRAACQLSQFDALARILTGTPMCRPTLRTGGYCMGQLLGDLWPSVAGALEATPLVQSSQLSELYLYGKTEARPGRKMGHFIVEAGCGDDALNVAQQLRNTVPSPK
jgi:5-(carboxyamino)imidazole ribonucleotide synthase